LLGKPFIVKMDNVAISYFTTQSKLSPKQERWKDFLAEFDMNIEYWLSKLNATTEALSRKAQPATLEEDELPVTKGNEMQVFTNLQEKIKEGLHKDPTTLNIMK